MLTYSAMTLIEYELIIRASSKHLNNKLQFLYCNLHKKLLKIAEKCMRWSRNMRLVPDYTVCEGLICIPHDITSLSNSISNSNSSHP